jgi:hypothetical protein
MVDLISGSNKQANTEVTIAIAFNQVAQAFEGQLKAATAEK